MKIVISDDISNRIKKYKLPDSIFVDGLRLADGSLVIELDRDLIERMLELVPDATSWDEAVGLSILLMSGDDAS